MKTIFAGVGGRIRGALSRRRRLGLFWGSLTIFLFVSPTTTSAHITSLTPSSIAAGGPDFTLRVLGFDFDQSDTGRLLFDGTRVAATLISSQELRGTIPASLIASPRTVRVELEGFNFVDFIITGSSSCRYSISPIQASWSSDGGVKQISVTAPAECAWTARSNVSWVSFRSTNNQFVAELEGKGTSPLDCLVEENKGVWRGTTITVGGKVFSIYQNDPDCPTKWMCGYFPGACDGVLSLSRRFRDNSLSRTLRGQRYTQLYYKFSTEAVALMILSPSLVLRSRDILERYKPVIEKMANGEPVTLTQGDVEDIDSFLDAFASRGSAELRETLKALSEDLRDPGVLTEFNITITDGPKLQTRAHGPVQTVVQTSIMIAPIGLLLFSLYRIRLHRNKKLR